MSILEVHQTAIKENISVYHEFLTCYTKSNVVYGFVEGDEDPSYYRNFIETYLPDEWTVKLWCMGGKSNVLKIHSEIDWTRFNKNQIVFFIDRDCCEFVDEHIKKDKNIYITDNYSIENNIVNKNVCERVLTEICGFKNLTDQEKKIMLDLFDSQFEKFCKGMIPVMTWIIYWKKIGHQINLDNIKLKNIFVFSEGKLYRNINKSKNLSKYIHIQCKIPFDKKANINKIKIKFGKDDNYKKFIRGKYIMWFLVHYCDSVHNDYKKFQPSLTSKPKMHLSMSPHNAVAIFGPRARCPYSLKNFIKNRFVKYARSISPS